MMLLAQAVVPPVDPIGLPAAPGWFVFLLLLTMLLHFVFMNFVVGGNIIALGLNVAACAGLRTTPLVNVIYQVMPPAISMAITMGVAPLLFVQVLYGPYFYSANVLLGFTWLMLVGFLLTGFYLAYLLTYRASCVMQKRIGAWDARPVRRLVISLLATLCFLAIGWTLANNHELSLHPELWAAGGHWLSPRLRIPSPTLIPRYMHDMTGATAIGGLWVAAIGWWLRRRGPADPQVPGRLIRIGLGVATGLTMVQILVGFTFLMRLDPSVRASLLGFNTALGAVWTMTLPVAVLLFFTLMFALQRPDRFVPFAVAAGLAVLVMSGMLVGREQVRHAMLARPQAGSFSLGTWAVYPQNGVPIVFALLLVAGLAIVALMLRWITDRPAVDTSGQTLPHSEA